MSPWEGAAAMDEMRMFSLFDDSNFDAYDRRPDRYPKVLEAGLAQHGLELEDVLAVTQDLGLWAICRQGVFYATFRGVFKKRIETGNLIPYSEILEARVESSSPHTGKIVLYDNSEKKINQIDFSAGGPNRSIEGERAQCERVLRLMEGAWRAA